jgi:hypothetical protein
MAAASSFGAGSSRQQVIIQLHCPGFQKKVAPAGTAARLDVTLSEQGSSSGVR